MAFGIGVNTGNAYAGDIRGTQKEIACECWFTSTGKIVRIMKSLFKWLNRRSQKKSYDREGFNDMLKVRPLATPRIYVNVYAR